MDLLGGLAAGAGIGEQYAEAEHELGPQYAGDDLCERVEPVPPGTHRGASSGCRPPGVAAGHFPVGGAPRLVFDAVHHAAARQDHQSAIDLFGDHGPAAAPATLGDS
ncbi:hypothetical protein SKC41_30355 [Mycobacterium sp. 050128]|uniref:hypothetical protein n=1 Tax=Mycobacterium sp. 050128 TaxID=3096112 RepID=UPI002ED866AE